MIRTVFFACLLLMSGNVFGQQPNFWSRSEIGVSVGQMFYLGDLNQYTPFYKSQMAGGFMYRFNLQSRVALRFNVTSGSVEASDQDSKMAVNQNRNLSFASPITEVAGGVEFYYFPFQFGSSKHRGTAYLLAQLGGFYMNPYTYYNGEKVELQPLGTEGQGTALNKHRKYSKYQLCIPLGLGFKFSIGKYISFNADIALRKTFTDYLDDVKSDYYVDPVSLAAASGNNAAALSNRSLDGSRFGRRGTSSTKDWYVYAGGMITFRLGKGRVCPRIR